MSKELLALGPLIRSRLNETVAFCEKVDAAVQDWNGALEGSIADAEEAIVL
jgi:hypothetical protein